MTNAQSEQAAAIAAQELALRTAEAESWLSKHAPKLVGVALGAIVISGAYLGYKSFSVTGDKDAGAALSTAVETANARIGAAPAADEETPSTETTYPTATARAEKALEEFRAVVRTHGSAPAALWARLGEARTLLDLDKPRDARTAYEQALAAAAGDTNIVARVHEGIAFTYEAENNLAKARESFQQLKRVGNGSFRDLADYHLARLDVAEHQEVRAKEALRDLLNRLRSESATNNGASLTPYVLTQAELRLGELDSSMVPRGGGLGGLNLGGALGGAGGAGGAQGISQEQLQQLLKQLQAQNAGGGGNVPVVPATPTPAPAPAPAE